MSQQKVDKYTVIEIRLTDQEYESLERKAKDLGFSDVRSYLDAVIKGSAPQQAAAAGPDLEDRLSRRLERLVQDILNPFTQKVDELAKRLAQIEEELEEIKGQRPAQAQQAERRAEQQGGQSTALERLRRQGVVFQDELPWLKAPDRFFAKLEREGAVVITLSDGKAAVDPTFWRRFTSEVESTSLKDPRQVQDKITADLGDRGAALFNKMVKSGLIIYDEDVKKWRVKSSRGEGEEGEGEPDEEEAEGDEDYL